MCVLNELDFHLKVEILFFRTLNTKKCIIFYRGSATMHPRKIDQKNYFIQNTLQLSLDILAQKSET